MMQSLSAANPVAEALPLPRGERMLATVAVMVATAMQAADATIANVALPQLEHSLGGGVVLGAWVLTAYLCANALVAPLTGWLRRRFGPRRLFIGGIALFVVASLLCSVAPSPAAIIAFRIAQGAGGGIIHPLSQAILLDLYPRERHGSVLGVWGAMIMAGPILGPALGGVITDAASWRWVFVINLPLGLLAIWGVRRVLPKLPRIADLSIDLYGVGLLAIGVVALQLCLERGVGRSWLASPDLITEALIAITAFTLIAVQISRGRFSVFRPDVFRDVNFAAASFYNFLTSGLLFVVIVFIPALGQGPLGYSATLAGFTIVPRAILLMLTMLLVGQLIGKIDYRVLLTSGLALMAGGLALLAVVTPATAVPMIVTGSTLQSIGGGLLFTCLSTIGFSTLAPELRTDAAGVYSLVRQLGFASSVAFMTAVFRALRDAKLSGVAGGASSPQLVDGASLDAYRICFQAMAIAALVTIPGVWLFRVRSLAAPIETAV